MSYLNIHSQPLYKDQRTFYNRVGRPRVRFRRTRWYKKNLRKKDWSQSKPTVCPNKEDEQEWRKVLIKYKDAFNDICMSFLNGYYLIDNYVAKSWAGKLIYENISAFSVKGMPRDLEIDDIENRLRYIWFKAVSRYRQRNVKIPLRNYLFRMSLFELKWWVKSMHPFGFVYSGNTGQKEDSSLKWAFCPSSESKFYLLSINERLLLYYRYIDELEYSEIASRFLCSKETIRNKLNRLKTRLFQLRHLQGEAGEMQ
jgi:hypothetical protein